jgi:formylglycine-generating enzyme required for sulfatase activity
MNIKLLMTQVFIAIMIILLGGGRSSFLIQEDPKIFLPIIVSNYSFDMTMIPGGSFEMGCSSNDGTCAGYDKPLHEVVLNTYAIDTNLVTNAGYAACVSAKLCTPPYALGSYDRLSYYNNPVYANYPVINITWLQAAAFCQWESKRLPTEAEWEKAARGSGEATIYPWGNQVPDCTRTNYSSCHADTTPVGSYPLGASPYGVLDMVGNVSQWVNDWFAPDYYCHGPNSDLQGGLTKCSSGDPPYQTPWYNPLGPAIGVVRSLRGGMWGSPNYALTNSVRSSLGSSFYGAGIGFRCAR